MEFSRSLNITSRKVNGDTEKKKYNYISPTATAEDMQTAITDFYSLSTNNYLDAEVIQTYESLNEMAEEEEENNG